MKRLIIIMLLSSFVSSVVAQSHVTYEQVLSAYSAEQFKGMDIESYTASDGCTYSIGDEITIGSKSGKLGYFYIGPNIWSKNGTKQTISKITVSGSPKNGLYIKVITKKSTIQPFDLALSSGEIISKAQYVATAEALNNDRSPSASNSTARGKAQYTDTLDTYVTKDGTEFIAGKTKIVFNPPQEKRYKHIKATPDLVIGYCATVVSINAVTIKDNTRIRAVCRMELIDGFEVNIKVNSLEDALSDSELYVQQEQ